MAVKKKKVDANPPVAKSPANTQTATSAKIPAVSVVIPMYNSAQYIKSCLTSVLNQTLTNFEIICVDDCSTDDTSKIVMQFANQDKRIKLYRHAKNSGGAGEPRNTGIRLSRGKYIAFLDSDDLLTKTALEELATIAEKWQADVIHTERAYFPEKQNVDGKSQIRLRPVTREVGGFCKEPMLETDKLAERVQRFHDNRFFGWVQNKLYRRDFLISRNIFFDNLAVSEDIVFYFKILCTAPRIVRVPNITYISCDNPNSITRRQIPVEQSLRSLTHVMVEGSKILNEFMDGIDFFKKNPAFRQLPIDFLVQQNLVWTQRFYDQYKPFQIEPAMRQELKKYCGDYAPFFTYLLGVVHNYRKQIINFAKANKKLSKPANKPKPPVKPKPPLVSVIIPIYNAEKFIPQTLESLVYQTLKDFEVIVLDDCSTDNSLEVIKGYVKKFGGRLQGVKMRKHSGSLGLLYNAGLKLARGKYVTFFNSDSLYTNTALEELTTLADKFNAEVVRVQNSFVLWGGKKKRPNAPEMTDFAALTNPKNLTRVTYTREKLTEPTLAEKDIGERMRKFYSSGQNGFWVMPLQFYRRDFLIENKITFPATLNDKDTTFALAALTLAKNYLNAPIAVNIVRP